MKDNLFFNTGVTPIEVLSQLYQESAVESNFYQSPAVPPVLRCDVSNDIRQYFKKLITIPFRDCGFLKTPPSSVYPIHIDAFRTTALNMLMVDTSSDFETFIIEKKEHSFTRYIVSYIKNQFMILNVMSLHGVINKSTNLHRTVLSIGFPNHDYSTVLKLHKEHKLFNI